MKPILKTEYPVHLLERNAVFKNFQFRFSLGAFFPFLGFLLP